MNDPAYLSGQIKALTAVLGVAIALHPNSETLNRLVDGLLEDASERRKDSENDGYLQALRSLRRSDLRDE